MRTLGRIGVVFAFGMVLVSAGSGGQVGHKAFGRSKPKQRKLTPEDRYLVSRFGAGFVERMHAREITGSQFLRAFKFGAAGIRSLRKNEYADAMYLLKKAYGLVPSPKLLYYMATVYERLGSRVKARQHLEQYLKEAEAWDLTPTNVKIVAKAKAALSRLQKQLVAVHFTVNLTGVSVFLNGEPVGKTPLSGPVWLKPGKNKLVFAKQGFANREIVIAESRPGAVLRRSVKVLTPSEQLKEARVWKDLQRRLRARQMVAARRAKRRRVLMKIFGLTSGGLGVAALVMAGVFSHLSNKEADVVRNAEPGVPWNDPLPLRELMSRWNGSTQKNQDSI